MKNQKKTGDTCKENSLSYPLTIVKDSEIIAFIDFKGEYHCKNKNKKYVVDVLMAQGGLMKQVNSYNNVPFHLLNTCPKDKMFFVNNSKIKRENQRWKDIS